MAKKPAKAKPEEPPDDDDDAVDQAPPPLPPPPPQVSVPARASCLTFLVLLLAELIILVVVWFTRESMPFRWPWFIGVNLLIIVIPIVVYRAVALWMFDEVARFPDIAGACALELPNCSVRACRSTPRRCSWFSERATTSCAATS